MALVRVTVAGTDGIQATFRLQKANSILAALKEAYGPGALADKDGVWCTPEEDVAAGDYTYHVTAAAQPPQAPTGMAEMAENIISIKRLITASSEATRHASTIKDHDLDAVEAALNICFVPVLPDNLGSAAKAALEDNQEFKWEDNGHEAKHRDDYLNIMASKVKLPSHLTWSHHTDRHDILKASMHAGGATLPFSIGCRTDAMVTVGRAQMPLEAAIVATVEMKKKVVRQSLRQTKATYICASLKSQLPVISCVTDMGAAAVAYYTSGQKREDGVTIIVEHIFSSVDDMLEFLGTALGAQSVSANVLRWRNASQTDLDMPGELPNPKRVRLPVPKHAQLDKIQPLTNLANLLCLDDDVARMADVEGVFPDSDMPFYIS